jgi:cell division protein FtsB
MSNEIFHFEEGKITKIRTPTVLDFLAMADDIKKMYDENIRLHMENKRLKVQNEQLRTFRDNYIRDNDRNRLNMILAISEVCRKDKTEVVERSP